MKRTLSVNLIAVSEHFELWEFEDPTTHEVMLEPLLLTSLEETRRRFGHPIRVTSGYRTPAHNAAVGGVPDSRHLYGAAADLVPLIGSMESLAISAAMTPRLLMLNEGDHIHVHLRDYRPPA